MTEEVALDSGREAAEEIDTGIGVTESLDTGSQRTRILQVTMREHLNEEALDHTDHLQATQEFTLETLQKMRQKMSC